MKPSILKIIKIIAHICLTVKTFAILGNYDYYNYNNSFIYLYIKIKIINTKI